MDFKKVLLVCILAYQKNVQLNNKKYYDKANQLAMACDIGINVIQESDLPSDFKNAFVKMTVHMKDLALNPKPEFLRLDSLDSLENDFFTLWNEGTGEHVEKFWKEIESENLRYIRKDVIKDVLKRKKVPK